MNQYEVFLVKEQSNYNAMIDIMFKDSNLSDFTEENYSLILNLLTKIKIQKLFGNLINPFLLKRFGLYDYLDRACRYDRKQVILFLNSSIIHNKYPVSVMKSYKKKWPNMVFVLLYIDIVSHPVSKHANLLRENSIFDFVYTVDEEDAKKYSLIFTRTPYSINDKFVYTTIEQDLYFCGVTKDRGSSLISLIDNASSNGVRIQMDVMCNEAERKEFQHRKCVNLLDDYVAYDSLLSKSLKANCILDLVQDGQSALTLRPYEAVVYDRKLLTNNRSILEFEFYDQRYMQYFEKVEDIDWEWVKKDINVDYGYNGEFSPIYLMEDICKRINGETK